MIAPEEIRARIRAKVKAGTLPRDLMLARKVKPGEVVRESDIVVGLVRGYPCAGCDELDPQISFKIGDVMIRFHAECRRIWDEERSRVQPDD